MTKWLLRSAVSEFRGWCESCRALLDCTGVDARAYINAQAAASLAPTRL
jgi:hypothetical protein